MKTSLFHITFSRFDASVVVKGAKKHMNEKELRSLIIRGILSRADPPEKVEKMYLRFQNLMEEVPEKTLDNDPININGEYSQK